MRAAIVMSAWAGRTSAASRSSCCRSRWREKIVRHDGWDIGRVQRYMFEQGDGVARAPEAIHPIVTGGAGYKMSYLPIWGGGSQTVMRRL